jgi:hypothetical protein
MIRDNVFSLFKKGSHSHIIDIHCNFTTKEKYTQKPIRPCSFFFLLLSIFASHSETNYKKIGDNSSYNIKENSEGIGYKDKEKK